jgi:hypothetical protein
MSAKEMSALLSCPKALNKAVQKFHQDASPAQPSSTPSRTALSAETVGLRDDLRAPM